MFMVDEPVEALVEVGGGTDEQPGKADTVIREVRRG